MHRQLVCHLLRHWQDPADLGDLVSASFKQLQHLPVDCTRTDPWRCVLVCLHRASRPIIRHPSLERPPPLHLHALLDVLCQSIARLPQPHRDTLEDVIATRELRPHNASVAYGLRMAYLTQARALIRCGRVKASSPNGLDGDLVIAAQSAAFWTLNFASLNPAEAEEFGSWLQAKPLHLREVLLACTDELLLRLVSGSAHQTHTCEPNHDPVPPSGHQHNPKLPVSTIALRT